ncbi:MAG: hypothetical protein D6680_06450 [Cyanobacteria bacterium J007]|nr:MAG: hypothetical protein D6680_06450 [Cyanobacteria bacterium J007]
MVVLLWSRSAIAIRGRAVGGDPTAFETLRKLCRPTQGAIAPCHAQFFKFFKNSFLGGFPEAFDGAIRRSRP